MLSQQRRGKTKEHIQISSLEKNLVKTSKLPLIVRKNSQSGDTTSNVSQKLSLLVYPKKKQSRYLGKELGSSPLIPNNYNISSFTPNKEKADQSILINLGVTSKNWCLYDSQTQKFLGFRHGYKRQIASLTKIMTTSLCLQILDHLQLSRRTHFIKKEMKLRITSTAAALIGTTAQLVANTYLSIQDLLYGAMLPSGNDAAYTLAQYFGYFLSTNFQAKLDEKNQYQSVDLTSISTNSYVQEFISTMNNKVSQMNLYNTRFSNPHGLANAMNTSSAKDIIKLSAKASKHPLFRKIMSTVCHRYRVFQDQLFRKKKQKKWWNTNKLLQKDWEGVKTGQTTSAGCCLSSLKQGIFIVVLNCPNIDNRFSDTQKIYEWYMDQKNREMIMGRRIEKSNRQIKRIKTEFSRMNTISSNNNF